MIYSLKLLFLVGLLFFGAWGWGTAATGLLRRAGWRSVRDDIGPPLQVLLGIGIFFVVAGVLVAINQARPGLLIAWHTVGLVLLLSRLTSTVRRHGVSNLPSAGTRLGLVGVSVILILISLGLAIGSPLYNLDDDDAAYIYLAKRLSSTGGLIDPFNLRRITDYGGATTFHSLFLSVSGGSSLRAFELLFCSLLLVLVAVRTTHRRWLVIGTLLLGIGVILGHGIGDVSNLSPNYSITAFSLGVFQLLRRVPPKSAPEQPLLYVVIGIFMAAILALRFSFVVSVAIAVVIALFTVRGSRCVKGLLIILGTTVLCSGGWAIALFRSSGTPLFPLTDGNYNKSWPTGQDPHVFAHGIGRFFRFAWSVFTAYGMGWIIVAAFGVALVFLVNRRRDQKAMIVLLAASVGCLAQIAIYVYSFSGSYYLDVVRLLAPSTFACGLFALDVLWPVGVLSKAPSVERAHQNPAAGRHLAKSSPSRTLSLRFHAPAVTVALLLGGAVLTFGYSVTGFAHNIRVYFTLGTDVIDGTSGGMDRDADFKAEYRQLNAMIPRGVKVLAAVDHPDLLSFTKYTFATLDVVGAVSPPPGMPYFRGPLAKVEYLRRLGYQYVVADSPNVQGLYNLQSWYTDLHDDVYAYAAWPAYVADWQATVKSLEQDPHYKVRHAGSLALIRLE